MGNDLRPFGENPKFHQKWTPPDANWWKFHVVVTLPRNVRISPGNPLPWLDFLTLLTAKEEECVFMQLEERTCLDCHPIRYSIQRLQNSLGGTIFSNRTRR